MNVLKFKSFDNNDYPINESNSDYLNEHMQKQQKPFYSYPEDSDLNSLQSYLKTMLNRFIKADFLIGNDNLISKEGILKEVGSDYILLDMIESNDLLLCDIYSIKFVQII